jgi:putative transposase
VASGVEHEDRDGPGSVRDRQSIPRGNRLVGLVAHSDAGSQRQFTSVRFTERLEEIGARPSIGPVADSYETTWLTTNGLYKTECV